MVPSRGGEAPIARQERGVKYLGERDVHGVVGGQIFPQLPHTRQKEAMRVSPQWKIVRVPSFK